MLFISIFFILIILFVIVRHRINIKSDSLQCLVGKTAIVTGGNTGIGYNVCLMLASRGCRIIIADKDNADKTVEDIKKKTGNPNVESKLIDLGSFKSIRTFADDICQKEEKIDILCNNAGIGVASTISEDGLNLLLQINYFGPVLLTLLLLEPLKAAKNARVVFASSLLSFFNNLSLENLNYTAPIGERDRSLIQLIYGSSKSLDILAARELGSRLQKYNISVNAADPGFVSTNIFQQAYAIANLQDYVMILVLVTLFARNPYEGAQTMFHLASSEKVEGVTGQNYFNCKPFYVPSFLKNKKYCDDLWKKTNQLIGWEKEL